jgi:hypothetical protein
MGQQMLNRVLKVTGLSLLLAALFVTGETSAAQWSPVLKEGGVALLVDQGSIVELPDGTRKAWVEQRMDSPIKTSAGKEFQRFITSSIYRCAERSLAIARVLSYNNAGDTVDDITVDSPLKFKDIVPGSYNEASFNSVCLYKINKK